MKAKINGHEVEGTPEEIAAVLKLMDGQPSYVYINPYPYSPITAPYWENPTFTWTSGDS